MTSPVQRRRAIDGARVGGITTLSIGIALVGLSLARVALDPSAVWSWPMGGLGVLQIVLGMLALRTSRRSLADLEREHGVGAGSDQEIRRRHGL